MEGQLTQILKQLTEMRTVNNIVIGRLEQLEAGQKDIKSEMDVTVLAKGNQDKVVVETKVTTSTGEVGSSRKMGKERKITLEFGEDVLLKDLRLFINYYELVKEQNVVRNAEHWNSAKFRARELRLQF